MGYNRKDHFYKKAKEESFRSRAAYKLQELDRRFRLFRRSGRVLDLGAAPGGWLQVAAQAVGPAGKVVGMDRLDIEPLPLAQVTFLLGDLLDEETRQQALNALGGHADTVLSDMAPNISGIRLTDCARSFELASLALELARQTLRPGGHFVVKIFPGSDHDSFLSEMKRSFHRVRSTRPEATRKSSSEVYVMGLHFREIT